ncbi:MAG TPA: T9SS type A sorting domain-containing protein [Bacteroidia bacterium]|nr:T9SS type A sorting domain-containing protein [Bacteroidia bacterium]
MMAVRKLLSRLLLNKAIGGIFFLAQICHAQIVPSNCSAPASVVEKYRVDADRMAVLKVHNANLPFKDSVEIDKNISNNYLKALLAVYNATTIPPYDTIFKFLDIHTYLLVELNKFFVYADSSLTWMKNLRNNIIPTGNSTVDNLISKYDLKRTGYYFNPFSAKHYANFRRDTNSNLSALCMKFLYIPGVLNSEPDFTPYDVDNIFDTLSASTTTTPYTMLTYTYGWDDCLAGCLYRRFWTFKVYPNCSIEYLGGFGPEVPSSFFTEINEQFALLDNVVVFPNPSSANESVKILGELPSETPVTVTLWDVMGRKIKNEQIFGSKKIDFDLQTVGLEGGAYLLQVSVGTQSRNFKIFKQ